MRKLWIGPVGSLCDARGGSIDREGRERKQTKFPSGYVIVTSCFVVSKIACRPTEQTAMAAVQHDGKQNSCSAMEQFPTVNIADIERGREKSRSRGIG